MRESTKSRRVRGAEFYKRYFTGRTIDIGCGDDPVTPDAEPFDVQHGDANRILEYRPPESYDAVYSSHCLEHMRDVRAALAGWWALVKPGGVLVVVVPDEDLYEQGFWPSLFNADHKATFRACGPSNWSPVSYDLCALMSALPNSEPISIARQDDGYLHALRRSGGTAKRTLRRLVRLVLVSLDRVGLATPGIEQFLYATLNRLRCPIDQTNQVTREGALAQIEAIVRKRDDISGARSQDWERIRTNLQGQQPDHEVNGTLKSA
jgi:SAM-dependent methyltransferase